MSVRVVASIARSGRVIMNSEVKQQEATTPQASTAANATPPNYPDLPADALILLPVRNLVLFPGLIVPISVGRELSVAGAQEAVRGGRPIGVVLQRSPEVEVPLRDDLHNIGTVATILRYITAPDGSHHVICH